MLSVITSAGVTEIADIFSTSGISIRITVIGYTCSITFVQFKAI